MKPGKGLTLQSRVTLYFVLLVLVLLLLPGIFFYVTARHYLVMQVAARLNTLAGIASSQFEDGAVTQLKPGDEEKQIYQVLQRRLRRLQERTGVSEIYIFDLNHYSLVDAGGTPIGQEYFIVKQDEVEIADALRSGHAQASHLYQGRENNYYIAAYAPIRDSQGEITAVLRLEGSTLITEVLEKYQERMLLFAVVALASTLLLSRFLSAYILGPVRELVGAVHRLSEREYHPVRVQREDELGYLAQQFNRMAEKIRENEEELTMLHRQAANRAKEMEVYNWHILDSIKSGIIACQLDGRITTVNRELKRMLRLGDELLDQDFRDVLSGFPEIAEILADALDRRMNQGYHDLEVKGADGESSRFFHTVATLLRDDDNQLLGVILMVAETTQIKQLQEEITVNDRLAAVGQLAAGVAHEIRNPLSGISGFIELLQRRIDGNAAAYRLTEKVQREIKILNRIVTEFLAFSHPRSLQLGRVEIGELCRSLVALVEPLAHEKKVQLELTGEEEVWLAADAEHLRQALINIVRNAVEASGEGQTVTLDWAPEGMLGRIEIRDCGQGMTPAARNSVFNPFYTDKPEGTGLGLSITHAIIEKHHGHITVESEVGQGTTITIEIPLKGK